MSASNPPTVLLAAAALLLLLGSTSVATARPLPGRLGSYSSDAATLTLHFDTKDSALLDREQAAAIRAVLARHVFQVPEPQVSSVGGLKAAPGGQLAATFLAEGPALNARSVLGNCQNNIPAMFGKRLIAGSVHNATAQHVQVVVSASGYWLDVVEGVKKAECAPA